MSQEQASAPPARKKRTPREDARQLKSVINRNVDGILVLDFHGRVLFANPSAAAILGSTLGRLRGRPFGYPTPVGETAELEINCDDGPPRIVEMRTAQIVWRGHRAVLASLRDITARKRAELALRESEIRYRNLFDAALTANYIARPTGEILACNSAFLRIFGFDSQQQAMATSIASLYRRRDDFSRHAAMLAEGGHLHFHETEMHRADDAAVPVRVIQNGFASFDKTGTVETITGYLLDLTDRLNLEDQLRHAQKMEAVGRLAGGIAHDFNNLLTIIAGHSAMLAETLEDNAEVREVVDTVLAAAGRAAALTSRLLAFSRRQPSHPTTVSINRLLENTRDLLHSALGDQVELTIRPGDKVGCIRADQSHLEQILLNLAVNARDAMPNGGSFTIETSETELDLVRASTSLPGMPSGRYVVITVSDTGQGMTREVLSRIFEPFFTTKDASKGTGLGLSIVYGIVKQNGGEVICTSEPGRGARFQIYLPKAASCGDRESDPSRERPSTRGTETVLLVDDEVDVRALARMILSRQGYHVVEARDQEEALELARRHEVHLLLTDVAMPKMSGAELATRIQVVQPGIRVLYMSGYNEEEAISEGLPPGSSFIAKPFTRDELGSRVRELLDARLEEHQLTSKG